jgi:hypothetical protein
MRAETVEATAADAWAENAPVRLTLGPVAAAPVPVERSEAEVVIVADWMATDPATPSVPPLPAPAVAVVPMRSVLSAAPEAFVGPTPAVSVREVDWMVVWGPMFAVTATSARVTATAAAMLVPPPGGARVDGPPVAVVVTETLSVAFRLTPCAVMVTPSTEASAPALCTVIETAAATLTVPAGVAGCPGP